MLSSADFFDFFFNAVVSSGGEAESQKARTRRTHEQTDRQTDGQTEEENASSINDPLHVRRPVLVCVTCVLQGDFTHQRDARSSR